MLPNRAAGFTLYAPVSNLKHCKVTRLVNLQTSVKNYSTNILRKKFPPLLLGTGNWSEPVNQFFVKIRQKSFYFYIYTQSSFDGYQSTFKGSQSSFNGFQSTFNGSRFHLCEAAATSGGRIPVRHTLRIFCKSNNRGTGSHDPVRRRFWPNTKMCSIKSCNNRAFFTVEPSIPGHEAETDRSRYQL